MKHCNGYDENKVVIFSLKDDLEQVRNEINEKFIRCGQQYYEENEIELQKVALIDNELPCPNYTETIIKNRPILGCRALVQRSLRMVTIIVNEMVDWKEEVRLHSLKLLWEVILFSEHEFTPKFIEIFPVLAKCCQDDEQKVVKEARRVAFLMGQLLKYDDWMLHTVKTLKSFPTNLGILRCFDSLFAGADELVKQKSVENISKLIATTEISHNLKSPFQSAVLDLTEQLVHIYLKKINDDDNEIPEERYLFEILVKMIALSHAHDNEAIIKQGLEIYDQFCRTKQNRMILQGKYTGDIIENIEDLDCEHSEQSERILMLYGCIQLCGIQIEYFQQIISAIKLVMENSKPAAKVKVLSAVAMVSLTINAKWN